MAKTTAAATTEPTVADLEKQISALKQKRVDERKKIVEVATRMAQQHRLCEVVDQALREAGLFGPTKKVEVKATIDTTVVIEGDQESWDTMDDKQRIEMLSKAGVTSISWDPGGATALTSIAMGHQQRTAPVVTSMKVDVNGVGPAPAKVKAFDAVSAKSAYEWLYTSYDGRVQHAVGKRQNGRDRNSNALCGALSGNYYGANWVPASARGENRHCKTCQSAYDKLG